MELRKCLPSEQIRVATYGVESPKWSTEDWALPGTPVVVLMTHASATLISTMTLALNILSNPKPAKLYWLPSR